MPNGTVILENPRELNDREPGPRPDMSWWSEGLFIASIFPPLLPVFLKLDYSVISLTSIFIFALLATLCFALVVSKPSCLKNRLKAVTLGTALGNLILMGWCIYN